ncbi:MAG TPA: hypothetical protein VIY47_15590 [Ignavibacteriaceae bacterium]
MEPKKPPGTPEQVPIPDEEIFDEILEWTVEEEEAFLKMIEDAEKRKE